jgi:thiol-disulfide isomerase/thioredoxin
LWSKTTTPDTTYIYGQIIKNLSPAKKTIVAVYINDYLLGQQLHFYSSFDSIGRFFLKFSMRSTQDIFLAYDDDLFRLIVSPGDSVGMAVNKTGLHFFGNKASENENLRLLASREKYLSVTEEERALAHLEPEDYLIFRKQIWEKQIKLLDSFCIARNCTTLFKDWCAADFEVNYFNELLAWGWKNLKYGMGAKKLGRERKDKYLSAFMIFKEGSENVTANNGSNAGHFINLNNQNYALSSKYMSFIHNLSNHSINQEILNQNFLKDKVTYLLQNRNELSVREIALLEDIAKSCKSERDIDSLKQKEYYNIVYRYKSQLSLELVKRQIDWEVSQVFKIENSNTRGLVLSQNFCNYILYSPNADYYYNLVASHIRNPNYLKAVTRTYYEIKTTAAETDQFLKGDFGNMTVEIPDNEKSGDQVINAILAANKGKVIFIDFWGTWCGPCRSDFTKLSPLKSQYPFDSIRFVYLCCRSKESEWLSTIKKYDLKGTHYLLTDWQLAALEKRLKINSFPSYVIIDKLRKLHRDITLSDISMLANDLKEMLK